MNGPLECSQVNIFNALFKLCFAYCVIYIFHESISPPNQLYAFVNKRQEISFIKNPFLQGPFTYYVMVFFPIFDSPLPLCYTLLCFLKPPFTIMLLLDDPPPSNLVILVSWSYDFFSLHRKIYLNSTHTIFQKVFQNNLVLWGIMIITLFLVWLPPSPLL